METKRVTKWWFAWDPDKIERFLEGMAAQGWHVISADRMLVNFVFVKGEPRRVRYCADYQRVTSSEYTQLLADDGWSLIQTGCNWYIWSKPYETERPEIYTDTQSLIRRNTGIMLPVLALVFCQMPMLMMQVRNLAERSPNASISVVCVIGTLWGVLLYCVVQILLWNRKLARKMANR